MALKGYCGLHACYDCTLGCKLDQRIPCSPDCENLTEDGKILVEKCLEANCEEVKYIFDMANVSDDEVLKAYGPVAPYPYDV